MGRAPASGAVMTSVLSTVTPLSGARKKLARDYLGQSQTFSALNVHDTADGQDGPEEPIEALMPYAWSWLLRLVTTCVPLNPVPVPMTLTVTA